MCIDAGTGDSGLVLLVDDTDAQQCFREQASLTSVDVGRWSAKGDLLITATLVVPLIPVTDLKRAKKFYGDSLGLTLLWETPVAVRYRCGPVSEISIFKRPPTATDHTLAHFEVDDIEAVVQNLATNGVEFLDYTEGPLATTGHIAQLGPARAAWFRDPDGNILGLRQGRFATALRHQLRTSIG